MGERAEICWWEPWRAARARARGELAKVGWTRPGMWVRVVLVAAVLLIGAAWGIGRAFPGTPLPWPQLLAVLVGGPVFIMAYGCLITMIPQRIRVGDRWIEVFTGQSTVRIRRDRIRSARVEHRAGQGPVLVVAYITRRGRETTVERAVGRRVDVEGLKRMLGELILSPLPSAVASAAPEGTSGSATPTPSGRSGSGSAKAG